MRTRRRVLSFAAIGTAALLTASTASYATTRLRVSHHQVELLGTGRIRVVQLTDLHLGRSTPRRLRREALAAVKDARPDLVVMTGDYLNHSLRFLPDLDRFLEDLPCPCVAVLGNHDHWSGAEAIQRTLEKHGVKVLRNEHLDLTIGGRRLTVVGVDDGRSGHADVARAFSGVSDPAHALVLTHFPTTARSIAAHGGRLMLAGHTHGGQLGIPGIVPAIARLVGTRYLSGWYPVGPARIYVSPGIGSTFFFRVGRIASPEIAVLDLI